MRHEIGIDSLLFGADHVHYEGTWPNTWDWIRDAFQGVPEQEARAILGDNAIRVFNLDAAKLNTIVAAIELSSEAPVVRLDSVVREEGVDTLALHRTAPGIVRH